MGAPCSYCSRPTVHSPDSRHLYGRDHGAVWECPSCEAWVGCHRRRGGGQVPLGTVANAADRELRREARGLLDPLWKRQRQLGVGDARRRAYRWLAAELGVQVRDCQISFMHGDELRRVIAACSPPFGLYPLPVSAAGVRYDPGLVRALLSAAQQHNSTRQP